MTQLPDGFDIRFTEAGDETFLRSWLLEPGMLHWFPISKGHEFESAVQGWMGFHRFQASLTALIDDEPCALGTLFLMPYRKVAHECLIKIIVAPKWQQLGIGTALMRNLLHLAKNRFHLEICYVELVEDNPLEKIVIKLGFTLAARQEMFFKENDQYYARLLYDCELRK